jgi:hypothetical protein
MAARDLEAPLVAVDVSAAMVTRGELREGRERKRQDRDVAVQETDFNQNW